MKCKCGHDRKDHVISPKGSLLLMSEDSGCGVGWYMTYSGSFVPYGHDWKNGPQCRCESFRRKFWW